MNILADISTGHHGFADVCFLVAVILAVLAAFAATPMRPRGTTEAGWGYAGWASTLVALTLAALALGWLVL